MVNSILIRLAALSMQKALIFSVVLGGIYFAFAFDDGSTIEKQITDLQVQIEAEEKIKAETEQAVREVEQVRANVAALSEQFKVVSQKLPFEVAMADIIKDVDGVSRASGVSIKSKEPMAIIEKDFFKELPLKISVEGTYSEITMFLYYISAMERIMRVQSFKLAPPQQQMRGTVMINTGRLSFEGEIMAYQFMAEKKPVDPAVVQ